MTPTAQDPKLQAREAAYYTPDGAVDLPYVYTFDASGLSSGQTFLNQVVQIEYDSDFVLRSILGVPNAVDSAAGGLTLYNYSRSAAMAGPIIPFSKQYAVVPEKIYPRNTRIYFDITDTSPNLLSCSGHNIPRAQIAFQGVKRYYPNQPGYPPNAPALQTPPDPATYLRKPYSYPFRLNLNWFYFINAATGLLDINRTFSFQVEDFDFELHYIQVVNAITGAALTTDLFAMQLFDSTRIRPLASAPVLQSYFNNNRSAYGNPVFPVPPVVYPVWTWVTFQIQSLVCNTDVNAPYALQINFGGAQRIPVSKTSPSAGVGGGN